MNVSENITKIYDHFLCHYRYATTEVVTWCHYLVNNIQYLGVYCVNTELSEYELDFSVVFVIKISNISIIKVDVCSC